VLGITFKMAVQKVKGQVGHPQVVPCTCGKQAGDKPEHRGLLQQLPLVRPSRAGASLHHVAQQVQPQERTSRHVYVELYGVRLQVQVCSSRVGRV